MRAFQTVAVCARGEPTHASVITPLSLPSLPPSLPAYIQTSRALMICASLLGLPGMLLVLMSMPCVRLQNDTSAIKQRRARVGGVFFIIMGEET